MSNETPDYVRLREAATLPRLDEIERHIEIARADMESGAIDADDLGGAEMLADLEALVVVARAAEKVAQHSDDSRLHVRFPKVEDIRALRDALDALDEAPE